MLDTLRQDLRYALRTLRRSPVFTLVVVLTLALGIGANTAIFSVVEAVLLRPLPYPHSDRLLGVWSTGAPGTRFAHSRFGLSYPDYLDVRGLKADLDGIGVYTRARYNLTGAGAPRDVQAVLVSPGLFGVLRVRPALGRGFGAADLREPIAVLSHGLASQLFGGDPAALGRTLMLDGRGYTVVGVMPADFAFPSDGTQLWLPLGAAFLTQPTMETDRGYHVFSAVARMHDGVDLARARADLAVLAARINASARDHPTGRREMRVVVGGGAGPGAPAPGGPGGGVRRGSPPGHPPGAARRGAAGASRARGTGGKGSAPVGGAGGVEVRVSKGGAMSTGFLVARLRDEVAGRARAPLLVLLGVVGFVLLIACVNAANLLLARSGARQRELAVRRALGAGRGRLVGQLLTESVLLALAGGAVGLVFAQWGVAAILASWPNVLPRALHVGLDGTVLGFTLLVSAATGLTFGLAPALSTSGAPVETSLREDALSVTAGRRRHRLQHGLVVAEMALALVVLTGAGLLVRSFVRLSEVKPGYDTHGVLAASVRLTPSRYPERTQRLDFYERVLAQLRRQPGVASVSLARTLPMSGDIQMLALDPQRVRADDPESFLGVGLGVVGPDYFRALRIPLLAGRSFTADDRAGGRPVAVVNERLAKRLWPGQSPIGRTIPMGIPGHGTRQVSVVGEIGDVHYASLTDPIKPEIYMPYAQWRASSSGPRAVWLIARTSGNPLGLAATVRRAVQAIDPEQPVATITTMARMVARSTAERRLNMTLVAIFAALAFGLAVIGIYGVTAYTVSQRTREIGVRMALGAEQGDVVRMLLRETALLASLGVGLGLVGALLATRVLASLLYGVSTTDVPTFAATALVLAGAALLAGLVPARRAARTDPVRALRYE